MYRKAKLLIEDILEAIERIEEYTNNMDFKDFLNDRKTQDAVIRNLEVIGEAAKNIPEELKAKSREIPWREMVGLRNILIHGYFIVDLEIIWNILSNELEPVKVTLRKFLMESSDDFND